MYKTSDIFLKQRIEINKYKIPSILFYNKIGLVPNPFINIVTVVGKAI